MPNQTVQAHNGLAGNAQISTRPPWVCNPYRLTSWWDMEQFNAERFFLTGELLQQIDSTLVTTNSLNKNFSSEVMNHILQECKSIGLRISCNAIEKVLRNLKDEPLDVETIKRNCQTIRDVIAWEMKDMTFLYMPPQRAERYEKEQAFGGDINQKFLSASFDIKEAGSCFAGARYTACVFHLMRALELGLASFARVFNVPSDHTNWHNIIEGTESKIRDMGKDPNKAIDWKEKQEQYAQIANSFMFFKDAWRNYTAHARGKYTEDEADSIYRNVRSFMQGLAKVGISE